jgi:DNA-binding winged helix-turn-helix (wHTH) protein
VARVRTVRRRGYRYDPAGERSSPS